MRKKIIAKKTKTTDALEDVIYRKSCGVLQTEMILVNGVPQPPSRGVLTKLRYEREGRKS